MEFCRNQLWQVSFETFYDAYYEEIVADSLINRWQWLDEGTKLLVAVTAIGSVISGWALWNKPDFAYVWTSMSGLAAVLALIHAALGIPGRLKEWGNIQQFFTGLRVDLATFRYRMQIDPDFSIDEFTEEFVMYRGRYADGVKRLVRNDIFRTKGLENRSQNHLNKRLADMIASE